ncbi:hypothetical protein Sjap_013102 [Stephania japonica]|uniref:Uncharacterized protein n=1 Tax=Stephania japonica TaxID=461633 RepID=A0AAP0IY30_9MAGN
MIRKFAFDFYMSIPIWMSNIEEVVKVICMFMKHGELHPSHFCARRMTKVFKRWMILKGIVGSRCSLIIKTNTGDNGRWDDALPEDLVRAAYDELASTRYTALMHKLKKNRASDARIGTPRSKATGTGPSKHGGGSVSFATTQERLADSSEAPPSVNDLYLHLHTVNHDRTTFIDTRSERFYDRLRADVGSDPATPEQSVDDEAVYLNVAGECSKGRVYGLGSVGRKKRRYGTPGASTSQTPDVVRGRVRCRCEQLRKVMNFMHQDLGMDMDEIGLAQRTTTTTATNTATS